jgi:hypothetical protein
MADCVNGGVGGVAENRKECHAKCARWIQCAVDAVRFAWDFSRLRCGDPESDVNDRIAVACHCQIASQEPQRRNQRLRNQDPVERIGMQRG